MKKEDEIRLAEMMVQSGLAEPSNPADVLDEGFENLLGRKEFASFIQKSGLKLNADDFISWDKNHVLLFGRTAYLGRLNQFFAPEIWKGNVDEMKKLWVAICERKAGNDHHSMGNHLATYNDKKQFIQGEVAFEYLYSKVVTQERKKMGVPHHVAGVSREHPTPLFDLHR